MEFITFIFIFFCGAIIGSFLNVVALRHKTGKGIHGRSFCFSCGHTLYWYDLVLLFSFLFLGRKCRYCGCAISWQYPAVELISAVVFLSLFVKVFSELSFSLAESIVFVYYCTIFSVLLIISIYDFHHKIIPNTFAYLFIALSFLSGLQYLSTQSAGSELLLGGVFLWLVAGPLLALPFAILWFVSHGKWIGLGDAKLVLGIGWLLGISEGGAALLLAFWIGALYALGLLATSKLKVLLSYAKQYTMKSELPFGPFLILGAYSAFLFNISLWDIQHFLTF